MAVVNNLYVLFYFLYNIVIDMAIKKNCCSKFDVCLDDVRHVVKEAINLFELN